MTDPIDRAKRLCSRCSVVAMNNVAVPLGARCKALVESGRNEGPLPVPLIPTCSTRECSICRGWTPSGCGDIAFCARHAEQARPATVRPIETGFGQWHSDPGTLIRTFPGSNYQGFFVR
jgi:hypothetical protein